MKLPMSWLEIRAARTARRPSVPRSLGRERGHGAVWHEGDHAYSRPSHTSDAAAAVWCLSAAAHSTRGVRDCGLSAAALGGGARGNSVGPCLLAPHRASPRSPLHLLTRLTHAVVPAPTGEKLLKSLLSRTPEWRSREARAQAAVACDREGHEALGRVMRGHDTSAALRKRDMLFLARLWGYKSTLWRVRMPRQRGAGAGSGAAGAARKAGSALLGEEAEAQHTGGGGSVGAPAPAGRSLQHAPRRQQQQQQPQQQHSVPPPVQGGHSAPQAGGGLVMPYMEATPIVVNLPGICGPLPALLLVQPPPLVKALLAAGPLTAVLTSTDLGNGGGMQRHAPPQQHGAAAQAMASMEAAHQQLLPFMTTMQQCRPGDEQPPGQALAAGLGLPSACGAGPAAAPQAQLPFAATMLDIRAVLASLSRAAPAG